MSGVINVAGGGDDDDDDDDDFDINFGITGSWANLLTLGQGWLFEVIPGDAEVDVEIIVIVAAPCNS